MKKTILAFLFFIVAALGTIALSACGSSNSDPNTDTHTHEFEQYTVTVDATCTEDGSGIFKCILCEETETRVIPAKGHSWGEPKQVNATCLNEGYTQKECSVCHLKQKSEIVPATGHTWNIPAATCTQSQVCVVCETPGEPAHGHVYDEGVITTPVSCTVDGEKTYTCTECHDHQFDKVEIYAKATGHILGEANATEAVEGCTHTYTYSAECQTCHQLVQVGEPEVIEMHKPVAKITKQATCSVEGEKTYICSDCHKEIKKENYTDENAHDWGEGQTANGITTYQCRNNAGHTRTVVKSESMHTEVKAEDLKTAGEIELCNASIAFDDRAKEILNGKQNVNINAGTLDKGAKETVLGSLGDKASRVNGDIYNFTMEADNSQVTAFGGKVTIRIPYALGENEDPENIVVWYINGATFEPMRAAYTVISGQGYAVFETEHFSYYTVARMEPAERCALYGHDYVTRSADATCTTNGYVIEICTRCHYKKQDKILPVAGHMWVETIQAATCTENGKLTQKCQTCGAILETVLFATGHKWVFNKQLSTTATCSASGKSHYDCSECGDSYEILEEQRAHEWKISVIGPTCTLEGYTHKECVNCGVTIDTDEKAALGHDIVDAVVDPTCTEQGFTTHICSRCGYKTDNTDAKAALGHNIVNGVCARCGLGCPHDWGQSAVVEATCTDEGYTEFKCSMCGQTKQENVTAAVGHDFQNYIEETAATCVKNRTAKGTCTRCGATDVREAEGSALGHNFQSGVCSVCGEKNWEEIDLSFLDIYCGTYGYNYFATMKNGAAMQRLYQIIDQKVRVFHVDTSRSPDDFIVAKINFVDLGLTNDEAVSVWKTYKDDNPLFYWLSNTVSYNENELILLVEEEYADGDQRDYYNHVITSQIDTYLSRINKNDGAYRKALGFHDFILYAVNYSYQENGEPEDAAWAHNVIGVFTGQGAVCEGYARTFQLLLNVAGVENIFVSGIGGGEDHAWNLARMDDGNWYWFDLTWDDTFVGGFNADWKWGIAYNFFCVTDTTDVNKTEGGWGSSYVSFLERHTPDSKDGKAGKFLYELPARSTKEFTSEEFLLLNEEFSAAPYTAMVVGYDAVELHAIERGGNVVIPEVLEYKGHSYTVISLGTQEGLSVCREYGTAVAIPRTVKFIWDGAFQYGIKSFEVAPENPYFTSKDGVLFTKSLYTLIQYPSAHPRTEYTIPDETVEVAYWSFEKCECLQQLTVGPNVATVGEANWGGGYHDHEPESWVGGNVVLGEFSRISNSFAKNGKILIDERNRTFCGDDVAIYNYEKTELLCVFDRSVTAYQIPASISYIHIDDEAIDVEIFAPCENLERLTVDPENAFFKAQDGVLYDYAMTKILAVPKQIRGKVTIPQTVSSIKNFAFLNRFNLTEIALPEGLISIGDSAFGYCYGLTSVTIPSSVTSIGDSAFSNCVALIEVWNNSGLRFTPGSSEYGGIAQYAKHVYSNHEAGVQVQTAEGYIFYEDETGSYLIGYRGNGTDLTLPDRSPNGKEYTILERAFYGRLWLNSIALGNGVTSIENEAFRDCTELKSLTIGTALCYIDSYAFCNCSGLTSIVVAEGNPTYHSEGNCLIMTESKCLFLGCKTSEIPSDGSVITIGTNAFWGCSDLTSIVIPDCVSSISSHAFYGCSGLKGELKLPQSLREIGEGAFCGCTEITSVVIGDSVTYIGSNAFEGCIGLTSIKIPSSVTYIGVNAFFGCKQLKSVVFEDPSNWHVYQIFDMTEKTPLEAVDLRNPSKAAEYLTGEDFYCNFNWERSITPYHSEISSFYCLVGQLVRAL